MSREIISSNGAPKAIGPYSQAIKVNGFIFCSGQTALDPNTNAIEVHTVEEQTERVLLNLKAVLEAAGSSMEKVVRCGVFLKDMNDFTKMNGVYGKFFPANPPARSTVEVARLPKDGLVEIDVIALA